MGVIGSVRTRQTAVALELGRRHSLQTSAVGGLALITIGFVLVLTLLSVPVIVSAPAGASAVVLVIGLSIAGVLFAIARPMIVSFRKGDGTVVISDDAITLRHWVLLRKPLVIRRAITRAVLLDDGEATLGSDPLLRFGVHRDGPLALHASREGWLWSREHGSVIPKLGRRDDTPNVCVLLEEPLSISRTRLYTGQWVIGWPPFGRLARGENVTGLLFTVSDLHAARAALDHWPQRLAITESELPPIRHTPERIRRFKRRRYLVAAVALIYAIAEAVRLATH